MDRAVDNPNVTCATRPGRSLERALALLALPLLCTLSGLMAGQASAQEVAALPVDIDPIDTARFTEVLEANRGNVVVVNLWATWCAPCLREIPELVELEADLGEQGLRLICISLDDPGSEARIREFRDEWFPDFRTFYTTEEDWFALIALITTNWSGVLPTSFVIDRNGEHVETLTGEQNYAVFEAAVTPHL